VGTSISSSGDGSDSNEAVQGALTHNPHLRWHNSRRGYLRCGVHPDGWVTDYRTIDYVSRPGAPVRTASSWRVEAGRPEVERLG
jgi:alkaline phosphatase D